MIRSSPDMRPRISAWLYSHPALFWSFRMTKPFLRGLLPLPSLLLCLATVSPAQTPWEYWPGAKYNPAIPTIKSVLGYEPGERITSHAGLMTYLEALAKASPRIKLYPYAQTWEGRKLVYAVIASEENIRRIDEIKSAWQKFADPKI